MEKSLPVSSSRRTEMIDITAEVEKCVRTSSVSDGVCHVYVPHTTAAVTVNENADPTVPADILMGLETIVPRSSKYRHSEGNSDAHIKSTLVGHNKILFIRDKSLNLGTWQGIFFCEFDGPRQRKVLVKIVPVKRSPGLQNDNECKSGD